MNELHWSKRENLASQCSVLVETIYSLFLESYSYYPLFLVNISMQYEWKIAMLISCSLRYLYIFNVLTFSYLFYGRLFRVTSVFYSLLDVVYWYSDERYQTRNNFLLGNVCTYPPTYLPTYLYSALSHFFVRNRETQTAIDRKTAEAGILKSKVKECQLKITLIGIETLHVIQNGRAIFIIYYSVIIQLSTSWSLPCAQSYNILVDPRCETINGRVGSSGE